MALERPLPLWMSHSSAFAFEPFCQSVIVSEVFSTSGLQRECPQNLIWERGPGFFWSQGAPAAAFPQSVDQGVRFFSRCSEQTLERSTIRGVCFCSGVRGCSSSWWRVLGHTGGSLLASGQSRKHLSFYSILELSPQKGLNVSTRHASAMPGHFLI